VDIIKHLGVTSHTNLEFRDHIINTINKAYSVLGIIKRNCMHLSGRSFCTIYKAMVRSQLKYAVSVWETQNKYLHLNYDLMRTHLKDLNCQRLNV